MVYTVTRALLQNGVKYLVFSGGEPLLAEGIMGAAHALKGRAETALLTNGRLLPAMSQQDLRRSFDHFQVALQSPREQVHDLASGVVGAWKETMAGIEWLLKAGVPFGVVATVTSLNLEGLSDMPGFLRELGVRFLGLNRMCPPPSFRSADRLAVSSKDLRAILREVALKCTEQGIVFRILSGVPALLYRGDGLLAQAARGCGLGLPTGVTVRPDGSVAPCPPLDIDIGSYTNIRSAAAKKVELAKVLRSRVLDNDKCRRCRHFSACQGGCRAAAYNATGSWEASDPFCYRSLLSTEGTRA